MESGAEQHLHSLSLSIQSVFRQACRAPLLGAMLPSHSLSLGWQGGRLDQQEREGDHCGERERREEGELRDEKPTDRERREGDEVEGDPTAGDGGAGERERRQRKKGKASGKAARREARAGAGGSGCLFALCRVALCGCARGREGTAVDLLRSVRLLPNHRMVGALILAAVLSESPQPLPLRTSLLSLLAQWMEEGEEGKGEGVHPSLVCELAASLARHSPLGWLPSAGPYCERLVGRGEVQSAVSLAVEMGESVQGDHLMLQASSRTHPFSSTLTHCWSLSPPLTTAPSPLLTL